jgi:hypothetical protein
VTALLHLLDHLGPLGFGTALAGAIGRAVRSGWIVEAARAPLHAKDRIKERNFSWNGEKLH